ncbi:hypothetical protein ACTXT7_012673 [Hymenolepis weldensis]
MKELKFIAGVPKFDVKQLQVDNRELSQELLNLACDFKPELGEDANGILNPRSGSNGQQK